MGTVEQLQKDVTDLKDAITAENTVVDSAVTLLNGQTAKYDALNKQLQDAIAANAAAANDPAIAAAAAYLEAQNQIIKDKTAELATAVAAGTPADPTPAPQEVNNPKGRD